MKPTALPKVLEEHALPSPCPIRILHVDHTPLIGGAELSLLELVETLDSRCKSAVVCTDACPEFVRMLNEAGVDTFTAGMPRIRGFGSAAALAWGIAYPCCRSDARTYVWYPGGHRPRRSTGQTTGLTSF